MTALNGTDHGWVYNNLEPGSTRPWNSIFDELSAHNRTWKIYYALPPSILDGTVWDRIIPPADSQDLTTATQFFADLADGGLPDFSFVRPGVGYSTEPPEDVKGVRRLGRPAGERGGAQPVLELDGDLRHL